MVCSTSLSKSTSKYFEGSMYEVSYGNVRLSPLLFQDDSLRLTTSLEGARDGCKRMEMVMGSKALDLNTDKSIYLLATKKKNLKRIRDEIERDPIIYSGTRIKEKTTEKWLGSIIDARGVKESTITTINERKLRIFTAINEIISIIEDSRLNQLGGLRSALDIWNIAIIPALLNNAEVFTILDSSVQKMLEDFQSYLLRGLLAVPKSCPIPSLAYESNSLQMKVRVFSRILNFVKHITCQDEVSNLSKQILNEQLANKWDGLTKDAQLICDEINLSGLFNTDIGKIQFKSLVKKACRTYNDKDLKHQIAQYKKMSALRDEESKGNGYFFNQTLYNARTIFRFRTELFEAKLNFKQKPEYKRENYLCDSCESAIDSNSHVLYCPSYSDLRQDKNMNNDSDLANYLQKVLEIRTKLRLNR